MGHFLVKSHLYDSPLSPPHRYRSPHRRCNSTIAPILAADSFLLFALFGADQSGGGPNHDTNQNNNNNNKTQPFHTPQHPPIDRSNHSQLPILTRVSMRDFIDFHSPYGDRHLRTLLTLFYESLSSPRSPQSMVRSLPSRSIFVAYTAYLFLSVRSFS